MDLIKEKEIKLKNLDGIEKTFYISRFPATVARKMISQYPLTAAPKIGDYSVNHALMVELMSFVDVETSGGTRLRLKTASLIDNHVDDGEMLMKLEYAMLEYNTNLFKIGKISKALEGFTQNIPQLITKMLTRSLQQLQGQGKQQSKS